MNITDCGLKRGVEVFESRPSLGFQRNKSSTWEEVGAYELGLGSNLGLTGSAYYGYDNVSIGSSKDTIHVERSAVAAYATPDFWIGQLGLSNSPVFMNEANQPVSFLSMLKEKRHIPSLSFGYQAGSPVRRSPVKEMHGARLISTRLDEGSRKLGTWGARSFAPIEHITHCSVEPRRCRRSTVNQCHLHQWHSEAGFVYRYNGYYRHQHSRYVAADLGVR